MLGFDDFCPHQFGRALPWTPCFMPKWANEPAMEVADFVAHAVGGQARNILKHDARRNFRRDFQAVFHAPASALVSYRHIRDVVPPATSVL